MDLQTFFQEHPKVAVAFSGGVDSSYLLWEAVMQGAEVKAYYVQSVFQPEFEREDALRVAKQTSAQMEILPVDVLADPVIAANPANRCYYCKQKIFGSILAAAARDGYPVVLDGTNASDDADDRPGMKALEELRVLSPLRLCGLTKSEIREHARKAGLPVWNKPAYACLATRVPAGEPITAELLAKTERAENALYRMGFRDLRVRVPGGTARIQIPAEQISLLIENRKAILEELGQDFREIVLDLRARDE
ncbi:MAG: ATP-dependent sacrificial sulfur transferase LarE [Mogibacterium sp.]|nr:ATP-dependent sacrificial sulfur transferase LarE [Mogibacterium sp.]